MTDRQWGLVVERSSGQSGVALFHGCELVGFKTWQTTLAARGAEWIMQTNTFLQTHGVQLAEVGCFVCGLGPGSFSGIRSALAAMHGMALPGSQQVVGIASSAVLAVAQAAEWPGVTVVGDARRNRLWSVTYRMASDNTGLKLDDGSQPTHTDADFRLVEVEGLLRTVPPDTRIVTPEWQRLEKLLSAKFPRARLVAKEVFPEVVVLGKMAFYELAACNQEPQPIYLHPAVAKQAR